MKVHIRRLHNAGEVTVELPSPPRTGEDIVFVDDEAILRVEMVTWQIGGSYPVEALVLVSELDS